MNIHEINGVRIAELAPEGPSLSSERDAADVIGDTYGNEIDLIAIPVARFTPDVWSLRTGLAGAFIQKFVTYQLRLALIGDLEAEIARSEALRAFVGESNRGRQVWFVSDMAALRDRLTR